MSNSFDSDSISLLYFNKSAEDIWCRSHLDALADKNTRYIQETHTCLYMSGWCSVVFTRVLGIISGCKCDIFCRSRKGAKFGREKLAECQTILQRAYSNPIRRLIPNTVWCVVRCHSTSCARRSCKQLDSMKIVGTFSAVDASHLSKHFEHFFNLT